MKISPKRRSNASDTGGRSSRAINHIAEAQPQHTYQTAIQSELSSLDKPLSKATRIYFQERLRNRLYNLIIKEVTSFKARDLNQAYLARRLGKKPEQISRLLSGPGNLTLDTVSDLLLGLSGGELTMIVDLPAAQPPRNFRYPDWLTSQTALAERTNLPMMVRSISHDPAPVTVSVGDGIVVTAATSGLVAYTEIE